MGLENSHNPQHYHNSQCKQTTPSPITLKFIRPRSPSPFCYRAAASRTSNSSLAMQTPLRSPPPSISGRFGSYTPSTRTRTASKGLQSSFSTWVRKHATRRPFSRTSQRTGVSLTVRALHSNCFPKLLFSNYGRTDSLTQTLLSPAVTYTTGNHIAALDISDISNPKRLDSPDDDQPTVGPHFLKVTPDQKHLVATDYFLQTGDIGLINTPADYKALYIDILDDGSLHFNRSINFSKDFANRGGAKPHSSSIFDLSDPAYPKWV